jgi:uncharacterized protein YndB with AHSA1/START domain
MRTGTGTDRIEKTVVLRAPVERVWRAITDADEFGRWFGAEFEGPFARGERVTATIRPTQVDPEVAAHQEAYAGMRFVVWVEAMEAPHRFAFRWHPGGEPRDVENATRDETTLVTFELEAVPEGTRLTIRESGFDVIPAERRAKAMRENDEGWDAQSRLIAKYLAAAA